MIGRHFNDYREYGTLLIRVALGTVFIFHGGGKVFGLWGGPGLEGFATGLSSMGFPLPFFFAVLAGVGELMGGALVLAGIVTRYAAGVLMVIMLVALFSAHLKNGFSNQHGGFEYPFVLAMLAGSLVVSGGGKASVDAIVKIDERV